MNTMSRMLSVSVAAGNHTVVECFEEDDDRLDEQHERAGDENGADEHIDHRLGPREEPVERRFVVVVA